MGWPQGRGRRPLLRRVDAPMKSRGDIEARRGVGRFGAGGEVIRQEPEDHKILQAVLSQQRTPASAASMVSARGTTESTLVILNNSNTREQTPTTTIFFPADWHWVKWLTMSPMPAE